MSITPQDQLVILESHIKNLTFNQYNLQVSLIEENAKTDPSAESLSSINSQLVDVVKQIDAIETEITAVKAVITE